MTRRLWWSWVVGAVLAGCASPQIDVAARGTVAGDAEAHVAPRWPHPMAERSSRTTTTTKPTGDVVDECDTCEGGTCPVPKR